MGLTSSVFGNIIPTIAIGIYIPNTKLKYLGHMKNELLKLASKDFTADVVVVDRLPDSVGDTFKFGRPSGLVIRGIMVER